MPILDPFYLILAAVGTLLAWLGYLEWRLQRLLAGQNAKSLEGTIVALGGSVRATDQVNKEIQQHLLKMEERLRRSIQQVKTVRFNPFPETGGNHSFAIALLDEHGDGLVISTLYSREKTNIYAKPIKNRGSEFELTTEEHAAIAK